MSHLTRVIGCALLSLGLHLSTAVAEPSANIARTLQPFLDQQLMAGAVTLVGTPEKVLAVETIGWADIAQRKPMQADTVFWIASQSKPITAAALMILVDEGKISVDDPVAKHLPEFKDLWVRGETSEQSMTLRKAQRPLRVRDLLTHTGGLPGKSPVEEPTLDRIALETRVRSYPMIPLASEPGEKFAYSNPSINTAGRIVEVVSGQPFETFLDERIFRPLGMKDTTFWPHGEQLTRLAKAYKPSAGGLEETKIDQLHYPLDSHERRSFPGGGLFSTAHDLWLFYRMLARDGVVGERRILSTDAIRQITTAQTTAAHRSFGMALAADGSFYGHGGAYGTNSRYNRTNGLITVFLVQQARWEKGGEKIQPAFLQAAATLFTPSR